jgi:hypothetical protein
MPMMSWRAPLWRGICGATLLLAQVAPGLALDIRSLELRSSRGEPLQAIVRLRAFPETRFLPECLRILIGDPGDMRLTLETTLRRDGDRIVAQVRAAEALTVSETAMRIVAGCAGEPEVFRSFLVTVPQGDATVPAASSGVPPTVDRTPHAPLARAPVRSGSTDRTESSSASAIPSAPSPPTAVQAPLAAPPRAAGSESGATPAIRSAASHGRAFVLRLSADDLDTSITSRVTDTQRNVLKAYRRLIEADDSTARLMELEDRIRGLELELARIRTAPAGPRSPAAGADPGAQRSAAPVPLASPSSGVAPLALPQPDEGLSLFTRLVAGIVLATWSFVAAWHVARRRYVDRAARLDALGSPVATSGRMAAVEPTPRAPRENDAASHGDLDLDLSGALGGADTSHLILSDVDLFLALGRHESAVGLLRDELDRDPGNRRYWEKLARIHAAHGHRGEWERALGAIAGRFGAEAADALRRSNGHQ